MNKLYILKIILLFKINKIENWKKGGVGDIRYREYLIKNLSIFWYWSSVLVIGRTDGT